MFLETIRIQNANSCCLFFLFRTLNTIKSRFLTTYYTFYFFLKFKLLIKMNFYILLFVYFRIYYLKLYFFIRNIPLY